MKICNLPLLKKDNLKIHLAFSPYFCRKNGQFLLLILSTTNRDSNTEEFIVNWLSFSSKKKRKYVCAFVVHCCFVLQAWYLYKMVTQNMLRTHELKIGLFGEKF